MRLSSRMQKIHLTLEEGESLEVDFLGAGSVVIHRPSPGPLQFRQAPRSLDEVRYVNGPDVHGTMDDLKQELRRRAVIALEAERRDDEACTGEAEDGYQCCLVVNHSGRCRRSMS